MISILHLHKHKFVISKAPHKTLHLPTTSCKCGLEVARQTNGQCRSQSPLEGLAFGSQMERERRACRSGGWDSVKAMNSGGNLLDRTWLNPRSLCGVCDQLLKSCVEPRDLSCIAMCFACYISDNTTIHVAGDHTHPDFARGQ